jgi:hypothetical protein
MLLFNARTHFTINYTLQLIWFGLSHRRCNFISWLKNRRRPHGKANDTAFVSTEATPTR